MLWNREKFKLVFVISVLLVTGFLVTSLASFLVSRFSLRSEIALNELPITSDNIYSEIKYELTRPVLISSLMANDTFLRDWVINGEVEEERIRRFLKETQIKYNTVTSFFVSEKTKNYYHADGLLKKVSPYENRDVWYFRVRDIKKDHEVNIDIDLANSDTMTIFINYRVFDYNGNYIGATGVGLKVNTVKKLIDDYQKKYNRTIYFIDRAGNIKLSGADFDNTITNISSFGYYSRIEGQLGSNKEHSFNYKKEGQVVHTNIRCIEEFQWCLVVEQPENKTMRPIYLTLLINLGICLVVTIIILLLVNCSIVAYQKRIETLRGIVPICSYCKQIRDDKGYWSRVEAYIEQHTEAKFSHSICPDCLKKHYPDFKSPREDKKS